MKEDSSITGNASERVPSRATARPPRVQYARLLLAALNAVEWETRDDRLPSYSQRKMETLRAAIRRREEIAYPGKETR